jgi:hypothetical protein
MEEMHHANVNLKSRAQEIGAAVGPERLRKTRACRCIVTPSTPIAAQQPARSCRLAGNIMPNALLTLSVHREGRASA